VAVSDLACQLMFAKSVHTECIAPAHCWWWKDVGDERARSGYLLNSWCCDCWNSPSVCILWAAVSVISLYSDTSCTNIACCYFMSVQHR